MKSHVLPFLSVAIWGGIVALLLALFFLLFPISDAAKASFFHLGIFEETLKFFATVLTMFLFGSYGLSAFGVAAGFGVTEAGVRFLASSTFSPIPVGVHLVAGLCMAFFFSRALKSKTSGQRMLYHAAALSLPIAFHLFYNTAIVPYLVKILA